MDDDQLHQHFGAKDQLGNSMAPLLGLGRRSAPHHRWKNAERITTLITTTSLLIVFFTTAAFAPTCCRARTLAQDTTAVTDGGATNSVTDSGAGATSSKSGSITTSNNNATNGGNVTADLGPWAEGTDFSVPVTAKGFYFGTAGENFSLVNNSCGYGPLSSRYVVGISPLSPLTGATNRPQSGCGTCLEVACEKCNPACLYPDAAADLTPRASPGLLDPPPTSERLAPGRLLLSVADSCGSCGPLDLNMHVDAFAELADPRVGVTNLTYRMVTCPALGRNLSVYVDSYRNTSGGWLRLSVRNVAGNGLAEVALAHCPRPAASNASAEAATAATTARLQGGRGGGLTPSCGGTLRGPSWRRMRNTVGAEWEFSGLPRLPLDLRLSDVDGQEIIVWDAITNTTAPQLYGTQSQFSPPAPVVTEFGSGKGQGEP